MKVLVAIADVDALVKKGTPLDARAAQNTTSVYTAGGVFPMLPEKLSTDLTSLNQDEDRLAVVIEYVVNADGTLGDSNVFRALVRNKAKLAYDSVDAWRDGRGEMPAAMARVPGIDAQIRLQEDVSQRLRRLRYAHGALDLQTIEARAVFDGEEIRDLTVDEENQPRQLIEDFMIAANGVTARYLEEAGFAALRRVVRSPERWQRIVSVAAEHGFSLPGEPDSKALEAFLAARRKADPLRFPDLSLVIVKLMGAGEYVVELPGREPIGHFGLAVRDYTHSTAPNRRYPDVITQRLLKAALAHRPSPYSVSELNGLAAPLHGAGGRREQGRAPRAQGGGRAPPRDADRRALRRGRDRRVGEGHVGAHLPAARRGQGRARRGGARSRGQGAREARLDGRRARLHRLRQGLTLRQEPDQELVDARGRVGLHPVARVWDPLDRQARHPAVEPLEEAGAEVAVALAPDEERPEIVRPRAAADLRRKAQRRPVVVHGGRERAGPREGLLVEADVLVREGAAATRDRAGASSRGPRSSRRGSAAPEATAAGRRTRTRISSAARRSSAARAGTRAGAAR